MRHAGGPLLRLDPFDVPTPDGVERAATLAEAVDGATLVLGLTGAKAARAIASDLAPLMGAAAVLADMNSGSVRFKREVARALDGVAVADVAVMGSVPAYGARTPLIVSGAGSSVAAEAFRSLGAVVEDLGGEPGEAATRKLVRSGWMKGLGALIVEAGEAAGLGDWARGQIAAELAGGEASAERLHASTLKHAARRSRAPTASSPPRPSTTRGWCTRSSSPVSACRSGSCGTSTTSRRRRGPTAAGAASWWSSPST